ncbi:MAG TPA: DNA-3-methyladenine glycosylase [Candidatus Saccharimonadales bacterium]
MKLKKDTAKNNSMIDLSQDVLSVAPRLLGYNLLVIDEDGQQAGGKIVEVEAYMASDAASHSYRGETRRTTVMFRPAGGIYVYFTYGMHICMNVVTGKEGEGEAVLVRALQPIVGLEYMWPRRFNEPLPDEPQHTKLVQLTNGPAKLTQALGLTMQDNGIQLGEGRIELRPGDEPIVVAQTTRIGITKAIDMPWRWYIKGNEWVSRR